MLFFILLSYLAAFLAANGRNLLVPDFDYVISIDCESVVCPDGHYCENGLCLCEKGNTGHGCGISSADDTSLIIENACLDSTCQQNCDCVPSCRHSSGYYCLSPSGYIGKHCNIPIPTLKCEPNEIIISVSELVVKDLDLELQEGVYLHLGPGYSSDSEVTIQACKLYAPVSGKYTFRIPLPFRACGTVNTTELYGGGIGFSNEVWLNIDQSLYDMPVPIIRFQCTYNHEYSVVTSVQPQVETNRPDFHNEIASTTSIELCKVNSCPSACPPLYSVREGAVYTVSEMIHVSMLVDSNFSMMALGQVVVVDEMRLFCSDNFKSVFLITEGCETTTGVSSRINREGMDNTVCVSFRVPRLLSCKIVYVYATLSIVRKDNLVTCEGGNGFYVPRKKRSLSQNSTSLYKIGPIFIIDGSVGRSWYDIFPKRELLNFHHLPEIVSANKEDGISNVTSDAIRNEAGKYMFIAAGLSAGLLLIVFIMVNCMNKCRSCHN